ncbi:hypothetical protein ACV3NL_04040 [Clostridium perfringens]|nr:hypothetical protein [Clostridium perfringens]MDK0602566.1 hypothetical protein [Clostridium perfringens]
MKTIGHLNIKIIKKDEVFNNEKKHFNRIMETRQLSFLKGGN